MRVRLCSILLTLALLLALLPAGALAANYDRTPIYLGYADIDYMAQEILKEIPTAGKSATEQIRAVYDWIIRNCSRSGWDGTYHFDPNEVLAQASGDFYDRMVDDVKNGRILLRQDLAAEPDYDEATGMYVLSYDSSYYIASFAYEMMMMRSGNCAHFSALLAVLLGHLGFDCRLIDGMFLNNSGSTVEHKWNYVLVDGQYLWLDVRMDHASYTRTGAISYQYFLQPSTSLWARQHSWDHAYSDWLAQNAADIRESYIRTAAVAAEGPWNRCSAWAKAVVNEAGEAGLIPASLYGADMTKPITRAEFAAMALEMYEAMIGEAPAFTEDSPFTDTADEAVLAAYGLGIVNGTGGNKFSPHNSLTREQAVTMLGRVCELARYDEVRDGADLSAGSAALAFADTAQISAYASGYVSFFNDAGIVEGMGNNTFAPRKSMTREQAIKVVLESVKELS